MNLNKYIGIPWANSGRDKSTGFDCWGFVRYFYEEEYLIVLPAYEGVSSVELGNKDCSKYIVASETYKLFKEFDEPELGDVVVFNVGGQPLHVGIYIGDMMMIHASRQAGGVVIESLNTESWKKRLVGYHRLIGVKNG